MTLSEFLLARIAEDEAEARGPGGAGGNNLGHRAYAENGWVSVGSGRMLAECEAKRRIVEAHKSWPVLVETPPEMTQGDDVGTMTFRLTQQIAWLTQEEYRKRFGSEPPTAPMLAALALPYADHPDFDESWRP